MNNLQKLIKLRGLSAKAIAKQLGHGYHTTQKVIKRATYTRVDGTPVIRSNREIEDGVAKVLGLTHDEAWGKASLTLLPRLIREEVKATAKKQERILNRRWLHTPTIPKKTSCDNV